MRTIGCSDPQGQCDSKFACNLRRNCLGIEWIDFGLMKSIIYGARRNADLFGKLRRQMSLLPAREVSPYLAGRLT